MWDHVARVENVRNGEHGKPRMHKLRTTAASHIKGEEANLDDSNTAVW